MNRIKRQLTEQSEKIANINRNKRKLKRKEDKQLAEINTNYNGIVKAFQEMLWTTDWDNPSTEGINVFKEFNSVWVLFCTNWNNSRHNIIKAHDKAFYEWAMDDTALNPDSKPANINGLIKPIL